MKTEVMNDIDKSTLKLLYSKGYRYIVRDEICVIACRTRPTRKIIDGVGYWNNTSYDALLFGGKYFDFIKTDETRPRIICKRKDNRVYLKIDKERVTA